MTRRSGEFAAPALPPLLLLHPAVQSKQRDMFNCTSILLWPRRFALANPAQRCADISRVLLGLAFLELLTMPITQHFWTWDRFLQGGQDFELGLFVIVTCLCLVLLRVQHCRQTIGRLLTLLRLMALPFRRRIFCFHLAQPGVVAPVPAEPPFHRSAGAFLAPLLI